MVEQMTSNANLFCDYPYFFLFYSQHHLSCKLIDKTMTFLKKVNELSNGKWVLVQILVNKQNKLFLAEKSAKKSSYANFQW